jgi:hypothetical protein
MAAVLVCPLAAAASDPKFNISFSSLQSATPLDGRLLLLLSTDPSEEPRMQINDTPKSQIVFGVTVDALAPGKKVVVNASAEGYPIQSLGAVPAGEYNVQAVLDKYETFHRADGHTVKLPMDQGEGRQWNLAPGNLYSKPMKVILKAGGSDSFTIRLTETIPPIPPAKDTKYVRYIRFQSELLTKFWGRPIYLGAIVLVPEGFDEHPEAHYPVAIFHGHFPTGFDDFRTEPPEANLKPDYSERFHLAGYNRIQQEEAYKEYQQWIAPGFPRFLVVQIQHANQYYDDSYAVNSENVGPYGDAIEAELIPYVEKQFRGIGRGWARFTYGGSTGGWEALAVQVLYPDHYNGAFAACPDPVDFRGFTNINLYQDKNAYFIQGAHKTIDQPGMRDYLGHVTATTRDLNSFELAFGDRGRSGQQFDIWQAVFSPVDKDGYPKEIFDKKTGEINHETAVYWRDHYDLSHIIEHDWATLGPKLQGKIHIYVGSADTYFLNDGVYYIQDVLQALKNPEYGGEVKYGERAEHCWNGDPTLPNAYSRLHYNTMYVPKMVEQMEKTAPHGADLKSWRY